MQKKDILNKCNECRKLLDKNNIGSAFTQLEELAKESQNYKLIDELNKIKDTFKYMVKYMLEGVNDNSRSDVYLEIVEQLRSTCDTIQRNTISTDSSDYYSEIYRNTNLSNRSIEELLSNLSSAYSEFTLAQSAGNELNGISTKLESLHTDIFNKIWVSLNDKKSVKTVIDAIVSDKYGEALSFHLISALILSLLSYYDHYKLSALIDIYEREISEKISARALVGIVLTLYRYPQRSVSLNSIRTRLELMTDSLISYRRIREVVMALIRTRDTDRVAHKMKEEVLPEIMKLRPDIIKQMREASPDSFENNILENNPEWEDILEKSGLTEKMQELSEMQNDGADLMMVAFSNLKQFPFFNSASNWFLPFMITHTSINGDPKDRKIIERIMEIGRNVCDSDKYSLAIALGKMPESQKQLMISQLDAQFTQFSEEIKDRNIKSSAPEFDEEVTKVIRDLYRFFKLFRKKDRLNDPFKDPFNFIELPVLGEMLSDPEIVSIVSEFYFKRKYYSEALSLFSNLVDDTPDNASVWEKIGFCYQSMKFYEKAIEAYKHAELLKAPGIWLINNLAYCNKKSGNFEEALKYYQQLLDESPEDLSLLLNAGYCAIETNNPETALQYYYHANYIEPDNIKIFRAIAWSEFLNSNYDKSLNYYNRILTLSPQYVDYLNIGHLYLVKGELKTALDFYLKASEENYDTFNSAFLNDMEVLQAKGIDPETIHILLTYIPIIKE